MIRNTSYNVRPDKHTSAEIALLKPEESVIVYDTDLKVNKFWNGASSGDINNYYSRFKIYIDGVNQTTNNSHSNYGWSGAISGQNLRVGKLVSGNTLNGEKIDELAIFDSDQSANVSNIYNSGIPFDLSTLATEPKHWWRMGDGDTYPYLQDNGTEGNCVFQMYNMTSADIVNDVP